MVMEEHIKIEKIVPGGSIYYLTLSGQETPLSVSEELVYKYRLKEGIVITLPQFEKLKAESDRLACDNLVRQFLAGREYSSGELKAKLARRQFPPALIDLTVKKYVAMGLVDDARYALKAAEKTLERNPAGRAYLIAFLQRKKIDRELAEKIAATVLAGKDETMLALNSLKKRWRLFGHFELERARRKAYNYLSRRGIGYEAAKTAFERLYKLQNKVDDD